MIKKIILFLALLISPLGLFAQESNKKLSDFITQKPDYFEIKGSMALVNKQINQSFNFVLSIAKNDSLSLKIFLPFGGIIGKLYSDRDTLNFFNVFENQTYGFKSDEEGFSQAVGLNLSFNNFISIFRSFAFSNIAEFKLANKNDTSAIYKSRVNDELNEYVKIIEGKSFSINSIILDTLGKETAKINCLEFNDFNGIRYPKKILVAYPIMEAKISVEVSSVEKIKPKKFRL